MYIDRLRGHFTQLQSDLAHRPILPTVTSEEVLLGDDRFVSITFEAFRRALTTIWHRPRWPLRRGTLMPVLFNR